MSAITFDFTTTKSPESGTVFRVAANWLRRQSMVRRTRRTLHSLPDAALRDIGIERSEIDRLLAERLDQAGNGRGPYPF